MQFQVNFFLFHLGFISICISVKELQGAVEGKPLDEVIIDVLKGKWDHESTEFSLPPLMTLVSILTLVFSCLYVYSVVCHRSHTINQHS